MKNVNYWVVGATFDGGEMYPEFIENSFWYMGWNVEDKKNHKVSQYFERIDKIKQGDRIAIKRLLGKGQSNIKIMAIGIVKKVVRGVIFIDWLVKGIDRQVPINGCVGTIYGPYTYKDDWTRKVFCI